MKQKINKIHPHITLVNNIQLYKAENAYNTKELADHLGIGLTYLKEILDGEVSPSLSMISDFSEKMGIPIAELFTPASEK